MSVTIKQLAERLGKSKPYITSMLRDEAVCSPSLMASGHVETQGNKFILDDYAASVISDALSRSGEIGKESEKGSQDAGGADLLATDVDAAVVRGYEIAGLRAEVERLTRALRRADDEWETMRSERDKANEECASLREELRRERRENRELSDRIAEREKAIGEMRGSLMGVMNAGLFERIRGFNFAGLLGDGK